MATSPTVLDEIKRPVPLALLALAVLGWVVVIAIAVSRSDLQSDFENLQADRMSVAQNLERQEAASGTFDQLQVELETARAALAGIEAESATVQSNLDRARQTLANVTQELNDNTAQLESVRAEIAPIDERLGNQASLIADADQNVLDRTADLAAVGSRLEEARAREAELQANLSQLSAEASGLADQAMADEARIQDVRDADAALQQQLVQGRAELVAVTDQRAGLEEAIAGLSLRREQLAADAETAQTQRETLQQELNNMSQLLSTRSDDLAAIEKRISDLQSQGAQAAAAEAVGLTVGTYKGGDIVAVFDAEGGFSLTPQSGPDMAGQYAVDNGTLTLEGAENAADGYAFPITCAISFLPTGFALAAPDGSDGGCAPLAGTSFEQQ